MSAHSGGSGAVMTTYVEFMHAARHNLTQAGDAAIDARFYARHAIIAAQSARRRANSADERATAAEIIRRAEVVLR